MSSSTQAGLLSSTEASTLLQQLMLSQASELARDGNLDAAGELLRHVTLESAKQGAASLDLLARIRVQQGAWREAEQLWLRVTAIDPNHSGALAALVRLRLVRMGSVWVGSYAGAALAVMLFAIVVLWMLWTGDKSAESIAKVSSELELQRVRNLRADAKGEVLLSHLQSLAAVQESLTQDISRLDTRVMARLNSLVRTESPNRELRLAFKVKGTTTRTEGGRLHIWLNEDPFDQGERITPKAKKILVKLAQAIVQTQERIRIEVVEQREVESVQKEAFQKARQVTPKRAMRIAEILKRTDVFPVGAVHGRIGLSGADVTSSRSDVSESHKWPDVTIMVTRMLVVHE